MGRSDRESVSGKGSGGDVFRKFHVQLLLKSSESQRERERERTRAREKELNVLDRLGETVAKIVPTRAKTMIASRIVKPSDLGSEADVGI